MKPNLLTVLVLTLISCLPVASQTTTSTNTVDGFQRVSESLIAGDRDAHQQTWNKVITFRDSQGNTLLRTNVAYVELQTGMHYWESNQWRISEEMIEPFPGGAVGRRGGHKVIFANDLSSDVVVDLQRPPMASGCKAAYCAWANATPHPEGAWCSPW